MVEFLYPPLHGFPPEDVTRAWHTINTNSIGFQDKAMKGRAVSGAVPGRRAGRGRGRGWALATGEGWPTRRYTPRPPKVFPGIYTPYYRYHDVAEYSRAVPR